MSLVSFLNLFKDLLDILIGRARKEEETPEQLLPEQPTVVLISGFVATRRALAVMRKRLLRDGFNVVVWSLDWQTLSDGVSGFYRMAEKLSSVVLGLRKGKGIGLGQGGNPRAPVFIVAHSAGGLVARYYVQLLGGWHYCDALITLGTPHQGLWKAALGLLTHLVFRARCLLQMLPISPFLKQLNTAPYPAGFRMISIYSTGDHLCGKGAAQLPTELQITSGIQSLEIGQLSHGDFLWSKAGYEVLLHQLELMTEPRPQPVKQEDTKPSPSGVA